MMLLAVLSCILVASSAQPAPPVRNIRVYPHLKKANYFVIKVYGVTFMYFFHVASGRLTRIIGFRWWGWSGGAMVLGKLPVPGRPTNLD